jgi:hypothetical protein
MGYTVYYRGEIGITPPLTEEDATTLRAFLNVEPTDETRPIFAAIAASSQPDLPHYGGLLEISDNEDFLLPEEEESRHGLRLWLVLSIEHFLGPRGYVLNGEVSWSADDLDDRGCIFVKDNAVEMVDDFIGNAGPSWLPEHYADERLQATLQAVVDSADDTGCSPDLTVVSAVAMGSIRDALAKLQM